MFRGERCDCTGCVKRRYSISTFRPAAQLASQADAAPFVGRPPVRPRLVPTCTGVTPAAVRSGRVCVRRGGWRAAVRSARSRAARLRRSVLGGLAKPCYYTVQNAEISEAAKEAGPTRRGQIAIGL